MHKEPGSLTEIVMSDRNELHALYYHISTMQKMQRKFPELLLLDATYRLNDFRIPLYVLMVEDGNGERRVVALWLVANEERDTISDIMDLFVRHNDCADG